MQIPFLNRDAREISASKLKIPKARELAAFLLRPHLAFARMLRCERAQSGESESIVFQVEVELGQKKFYDIRQHELIRAVFDPADRELPEVLALREDFPIAPHQNIRPFLRPRSLCLDEEPYSEQKLRWTALSFVERIREWLRLTARGELHQEDQPLEPLLAGTDGTMILPHDFIEQADKQKPSVIAIEQLNESKDKPIYRAHLNRSIEPGKKPCVIATVFTTPTIEHGIIHSQPANLYELHQFCQMANYDLLGELSARLRSWIVEKSAGDINDARFVLVAIFPKKRRADTVTEYPDVWVFCSPDSVHQIAVALGIEGEKRIGGFAGVVIKIDSKRDEDLSSAKKVSIFPLRPVYTLSPARAAAFNGFDQPILKRIVAIGMGALGSQLFNNLVRSGVGEWTLVDKDILLPHNCARHVLPGNFSGINKAEGLAFIANATVEQTPAARSITADVLEPHDKKDELASAFKNAEVILDLSASVSVARHLAEEVSSKARRISIFLNPSGTDLVLLAEDAARKCPLVWLEMEYYRRLANEASLSGHLAGSGGQIRYARSCGDVTSKICQNLVALHAAIGSQALREILEQDAASISVFRADQDSFEVRRFSFEPALFDTNKEANWTVCVSDAVLTKVHAIRKERLPNETGGVLVGHFDRHHHVIYVVDALGSPKDSTEWPTLYIRGVRGLRAELERISKATLSNLEYVGEWHSHPPRCAAKPSPTDQRALAVLATQMNGTGSPAVMLIVAERNRQGFFLR
jgi:hypothetical protein